MLEAFAAVKQTKLQRRKAFENATLELVKIYMYDSLGYETHICRSALTKKMKKESAA